MRILSNGDPLDAALASPDQPQPRERLTFLRAIFDKVYLTHSSRFYEYTPFCNGPDEVKSP